VATLDQFANRRRHEADAVLVDLDFLRHTDAHDLPPQGRGWFGAENTQPMAREHALSLSEQRRRAVRRAGSGISGQNDPMTADRTDRLILSGLLRTTRRGVERPVRA
jgi:hypothetical protein